MSILRTILFFSLAVFACKNDKGDSASASKTSKTQKQPKLNKDGSITFCDMLYYPSGKEVSCSDSEESSIAPVLALPDLEMVVLLEMPNVKDLTPLAQLPELAYFTGYGLGATDISALSGNAKLVKVELVNTPITDLSPLKDASLLEELNIDGTKVTDLAPIKGLTTLKRLHIGNTAIANLSPLYGLTALVELTMYDLEISEEQIAAIKEKLPNAKLSGYKGYKKERLPCESVITLADVEEVCGAKGKERIHSFAETIGGCDRRYYAPSHNKNYLEPDEETLSLMLNVFHSESSAESSFDYSTKAHDSGLSLKRSELELPGVGKKAITGRYKAKPKTEEQDWFGEIRAYEYLHFVEGKYIVRLATRNVCTQEHLSELAKRVAKKLRALES